MYLVCGALDSLAAQTAAPVCGWSAPAASVPDLLPATVAKEQRLNLWKSSLAPAVLYMLATIALGST